MADSPAPVLRVGCPMWAHRPWVGRFYPTGTKPGTELALYAQWCTAVEGNTTFYAQPTAATVAKWSEQTSDDFRFAFKLPRTVTHDKRLRDVGAEVRSFLDVIEPLGQRIGPVQVQLPGSFGPADLDALLAFLGRLPQDWHWALELRHHGFFDRSAAHRAVDELCIARNIGRVVLDTRPLYAVTAESTAAIDEQRKKPDLPIVLDAIGQSPIVRVIGEDAIDGTMRGLLAWVPQVIEWLADGRTPYVFVHQPENLESPGLARALHEAIAVEVFNLAPLPTPPGQTSMF
jgi:uncharacterized protein YecE (DUF72 family)